MQRDRNGGFNGRWGVGHGRSNATSTSGVLAASAAITAQTTAFSLQTSAVALFGKLHNAPYDEWENANRDTHGVHHNSPNEVVIRMELTGLVNVAIYIRELRVVLADETRIDVVVVHLLFRSVTRAIPNIVFAVVAASN